MTEDIDAGLEPTVPVWAVFGDLMSGLLGAFVLILVCVLGMQLELATQAGSTRSSSGSWRRSAAGARAGARGAAGGGPRDARTTGASASAAACCSRQLRRAAARRPALLKSLAAPLAAYLQARDEILMVSGFTDDRQVRGRQPPVRRQLGAVGPARPDGHARADRGRRPVVARSSPPPSVPSSRWLECRCRRTLAKNRRVEMAPTPRPSNATHEVP